MAGGASAQSDKLREREDWIMSDEELVAAAIELAGEFYSMMGYSHREGFKYWESPHPQERLVFDMAVVAFEKCRGSDVWDAISGMEDE